MKITKKVAKFTSKLLATRGRLYFRNRSSLPQGFSSIVSYTGSRPVTALSNNSAGYIKSIWLFCKKTCFRGISGEWHA